MGNNKIKGNFGEDIAAKELIKKGYNPLVRNYKRRFGEIDIICGYEEYIIFIEVKFRKNMNNGSPGEAVGPSKRERIKKTAEEYIMENDLDNNCFRFDVVEVLALNGKIFINHIENAFY